MTLRRGEHPDELISAAISGDLTDDEQARLDAHLTTCDSCRQTMAAWTEQRRLVASLRGAPVPRDLAPRIRTGIESGAFAVPWWRRSGLLVGVGATVATAAAALVAVAVIGGWLPRNQVASTGSPSVAASAPISALPSPSTSVAESPAPSATPPAGVAAAYPDYYLAFAGPSDNVALTLRNGSDGRTQRELPSPSGQPLRATLDPSGHWLAYITPVGLKGTNEYWVAEVDGPTEINLGESSAIGSPFTNGLFWSPDGRFLTFTLSDSGGSHTDAWLFDTTYQSIDRLTAQGDVIAAGWRPDGSGHGLPWITVAASDPISYELPDPAVSSLPLDPADASVTAPGTFQPIWNADGHAAIFWRGTLNPSVDAGYEFAEGGAPYLARDASTNPLPALAAGSPLFSDLTIRRDAFSSAAVTWGPTDAYAVWEARWAGAPQSGNGIYPDENRVYFSHLDDERNILVGHALDAADIPDGGYVSSVAIAPVGDKDYVALSIGFPAAGDLATPQGEVLLIKRNTGDVADELIRTFKGDQSGWYGPAVYPN